MNTKTLFYILKRILLALLTVWVVITITFFVTRLVPGGPFMGEKAISQAAMDALEAKYGLDKPSATAKYVTESGEIVDIDSVSEPLYHYTPVSVEASDDGIVEWKDASESNIGMFENSDPEKFEKAMAEVIKKLLSALPDIQ
jgi:hypothetical protein